MQEIGRCIFPVKLSLLLFPLVGVLSQLGDSFFAVASVNSLGLLCVYSVNTIGIYATPRTACCAIPPVSDEQTHPIALTHSSRACLIAPLSNLLLHAMALCLKLWESKDFSEMLTLFLCSTCTPAIFIFLNTSEAITLSIPSLYEFESIFKILFLPKFQLTTFSFELF